MGDSFEGVVSTALFEHPLLVLGLEILWAMRSIVHKSIGFRDRLFEIDGGDVMGAVAHREDPVLTCGDRRS